MTLKVWEEKKHDNFNFLPEAMQSSVLLAYLEMLTDFVQ